MYMTCFLSSLLGTLPWLLHWRSQHEHTSGERRFWCRDQACCVTRNVYRRRDFVEWLDHFENMAAINSWSAENKLLWFKVRLTGRAQTAFKRLPSNVRAGKLQ